MIAHIQGKLVVRTPTYIVVEASGVGYAVHISLNTFEKLGEAEQIKVLTHLSVKEDSHTLYGFADEEERHLFLLLISVSGVGTNTARMILSSLKPADVKAAISGGNWALLKTIKGIGPKTAQRLVIDLQDKVKRTDGGDGSSMSFEGSKTNEEALAALVMLGFSKSEAEKGLQKVKQLNPQYSVEDLIKNTLKIL